MEQNRYDKIGMSDAARRVGIEPKKQLAWLLEFVSRDESSLIEEKPFQAALSEIEYFTLGAWDSMTIRRPKTYSDLTGFIAMVREGIGDLLEGHPWQLYLAATGMDGFSFSRSVRRSTGSVETKYRCNDQLTVARWRAQELIAANFHSIAKCRRAACGRLFAVNKRQEYCSTRCSQIERTAKWRKKNPDEARSLRHEAYRRKVAREKGAAVAKLIIRRVEATTPKRKSK